MSAALSDTEADMFTRGRELEDRSSGRKRSERFMSKALGFSGYDLPHSKTTGFCSVSRRFLFYVRKPVLGLPSLSSGATSAEELFTGSVSPARSDFSCSRSGFSAHRTLGEKSQKRLDRLPRQRDGKRWRGGHPRRNLTVGCRSVSVNRE